MKKAALIKILVLLLFSKILISCTTIKINERDAFDSKRTVTADVFRQQGIHLEEISFSSDDTTTLFAWYLTQEHARGTVLYLGGNGFLLAIAGDILGSIFKQEMNVFAFDYRGYGQSSGAPSVKGLMRDAQAAYDYLIRQKQLAPHKLIIHGHSLGSIFALWLANHNEAAGLVLECPITDVEDLTGRLVPPLLKPFISFEIDKKLLQISNFEEITKLKKPLLILAGTEDKITPKEMAEELYEIAAVTDKTLYIIEEGGHNDLPLKNEYKNQLFDFYSKRLPEKKLFPKTDNR